MFIIANDADGYGVDRCLASGDKCGAAAANAYCKTQPVRAGRVLPQGRSRRYHRRDPDAEAAAAVTAQCERRRHRLHALTIDRAVSACSDRIMANGANLVAVKIAHIGTVIIRMIMRAQSGRAHIGAAGSKRRRMKGIDQRRVSSALKATVTPLPGLASPLS